MIRIDIDVPEPYCQECLEFEAQVLDPVVVYADSAIAYKTDTIISCQHQSRCAKLKKYLKETLHGGSITTE